MYLPLKKPHREFFRIALDVGSDNNSVWTPVPGFEGQIDELILADNLDQKNRRGSRTRIARWQPGALITQPVVHDFCEEVFIFSGDLLVGCDAAGLGGEAFDAYTFACRPPGVFHGPFTSRSGCLMFEFQYFD